MAWDLLLCYRTLSCETETWLNFRIPNEQRTSISSMVFEAVRMNSWRQSKKSSGVFEEGSRNLFSKQTVLRVAFNRVILAYFGTALRDFLKNQPWIKHQLSFLSSAIVSMMSVLNSFISSIAHKVTFLFLKDFKNEP